MPIPAKLTVPPAPVVVGPINFYAKLLEAISKSSQSVNNQQLYDAQTTQLLAQIETEVFQYYSGPNGPLQKYAKEIATIAGEMNQPGISKEELSKLSGQLQLAQTNYQAQQTDYDGVRSNADSNEKIGEGAVGRDNSAQSSMATLFDAVVSVQTNSVRATGG